MTKSTRDKDKTKAQAAQKPGAQAARRVNGQSKTPKASKASKPPKRQEPTGGNSDD